MNVYRHRKISSDNMLNHVNQKISYNSLNGLLQYWGIINTKPFNHVLKLIKRLN